MSGIARFYRTATAVSLVLFAILSIVFIVANQDPAATGVGLSVSAHAYLWSQAALIVGMIGVAQTLRDRAPALATIAVSLVILGGVAHAAFPALILIQSTATTDEVREAALMVMTGPMLPVSIVSLVGTVVGTVILAIALIKAGRPTWWIAGALVGWVVVEFFLSDLGSWVAIISGALLVTGFGGLSWRVLRSDPSVWQTAREANAERVPASLAH